MIITTIDATTRINEPTIIAAHFTNFFTELSPQIDDQLADVSLLGLENDLILPVIFYHVPIDIG
jgi:hypothetical protein